MLGEEDVVVFAGGVGAWVALGFMGEARAAMSGRPRLEMQGVIGNGISPEMIAVEIREEAEKEEADLDMVGDLRCAREVGMERKRQCERIGRRLWGLD